MPSTPARKKENSASFRDIQTRFSPEASSRSPQRDVGVDDADKRQSKDTEIPISDADKVSLVNDYAQISALMQHFDQQVTSFTKNVERVAYESAPAYAGLTSRWVQETAAAKDATPSLSDSSEKELGSSVTEERRNIDNGNSHHCSF